MKSLAKNNNQTAIIKLLKVLIQTSIGIKNVDEGLDDECIRDVVDIINHKGLGEELNKSGAMLVTNNMEEHKE